MHVTKCGFFVEKEKGILGASPDGLVTDPSKRCPHGIIEAKNVMLRMVRLWKIPLCRNLYVKCLILVWKETRVICTFIKYNLQQQTDFGMSLLYLEVTENVFISKLSFSQNSGRRNWWTLNNFMINILYMSWLTQGSEMALQDVIMANARLHNVLLSTNTFLHHLIRENANFC